MASDQYIAINSPFPKETIVVHQIRLVGHHLIANLCRPTARYSRGASDSVPYYRSRGPVRPSSSFAMNLATGHLPSVCVAGWIQ